MQVYLLNKFYVICSVLLTCWVTSSVIQKLIKENLVSLVTSKLVTFTYTQYIVLDRKEKPNNVFDIQSFAVVTQLFTYRCPSASLWIFIKRYSYCGITSEKSCGGQAEFVFSVINLIGHSTILYVS